MPLPLIPTIIIAANLLATIKGVTATVGAGKRIKRAKARYDLRRAQYNKEAKKYRRRQSNAKREFDQLGEIRLEALALLGKAVEFIRRAKIKERTLREDFEITPQQLKAWENASVNALEILGGLVGSGASGISTAAAAYGLVGVLGTASTGTAISTLSGAAATSATLAWLGGGSLAAGGGGMALGTFVLGGIVVGPAVLVTGFFAKGKASEVESKVAKNIAEMEVSEAHMLNQLTILTVIIQRVRELKKATVESMHVLKELLNQSNPKRMHDVYQVARCAKALGDLLDVAILDDKGVLIQ